LETKNSHNSETSLKNTPSPSRPVYTLLGSNAFRLSCYKKINESISDVNVWDQFANAMTSVMNETN
jgi:hypothetical protein